MTIRERQERDEEARLSPYAALASRSAGRPTHSTSRHSSWADSRSTPARRAESWMSPSEVATRTA